MPETSPFFLPNSQLCGDGNSIPNPANSCRTFRNVPQPLLYPNFKVSDFGAPYSDLVSIPPLKFQNSILQNQEKIDLLWLGECDPI